MRRPRLTTALIPQRHSTETTIEIHFQEPTGNRSMDPLTILLISLTTLVAANLAASRQKA